jgi:hypothetical protein
MDTLVGTLIIDISPMYLFYRLNEYFEKRRMIIIRQSDSITFLNFQTFQEKFLKDLKHCKFY